MRVAVLVKQVPVLEELSLGEDGRLVRDGLELELNPYCRRAVAKGVELAAGLGECVAVTMGPPAAADALREAIAWGADSGLLLSDPAFAGSDTLATARALAAALRLTGPYDLILTGRSSVDADTGQVGPQLAELLDLPFAGPVRALAVDGDWMRARCERDDGHAELELSMPAVLSAAERLCAPAKVGPAERAKVEAGRIRTITAAELGEGPWGQLGSPTVVGRTRVVENARARRRGEGPVQRQVHDAAEAVLRAGVLTRPMTTAPAVPQPHRGEAIAVLGEPGRERVTRELLGAAATLGGPVTLVTSQAPEAAWSWGADEVVELAGAEVPEDVRLDDADWFWAVLAGSTPWGREAAARLAARHGAGLTGDAVELAAVGGRLVCWKPAFGGQLLAAITATTGMQLATVRPGALPLLTARSGGGTAAVHRRSVRPRGQLRELDRVTDDDPDALALARVVVGVGQAIEPADHPDLKVLLDLLDAELGATRKVTDQGWLPHGRQIGVTGQAIAPDLYVALAVHGKPTHTVGVRRAGFVLAVNADPAAPIFDAADFGIVGDWRQVVPLLVAELAPALPRPS